MVKKMKRICITNTVYTLFLYFLIVGYNEEDIIVVSRGISEDIRKNINCIYLPNQYLSFELEGSDNVVQWFWGIIKFSYEIFKLRILLFFKTRNCDVEVYGQGNVHFSFPLYEYENSYIIEDGLANYMYFNVPKKEKSLKSLIKRFLGLHVNWNEGYGTHDNIKKVYLTQENVPEIIENKAEVISMKKLWNEKNDFEKDKILEIFGIKNIVNDWEDGLTLLLTQCYYEDNILSLNEEIEMYEYLINNQKTNNIVIKAHPRNEKDFKKIFPNLSIIDTPFPIELLMVIGIKINKIITVSSTSVLNFKDSCEIEIYDKKTSSDEVNLSIEVLKEQIL